MTNEQLTEIETEMLDFLAGRRSWWNQFATATNGGTPVDHVTGLAMCHVADAHEVMARASILHAFGWKVQADN